MMHTNGAAPVNQIIRIRLLQAMFVLLLPLIVLVRPWSFPNEAVYVDLLEILGSLMIVGGIVGRFWAILYIGAKKNNQLVCTGPYSLCRHPLYLFSTLAIVGFGLMLGVVSLAIILAIPVFVILSVTAKKEEVYLRAHFGGKYDTYVSDTPMILPSFKKFRTPELVEFSANALKSNGRDALGFLILFPMVEIVEGLQEYITIPQLLFP